MIAALYVARGGCYFGLAEVDAWDERRDARGNARAVPRPPAGHGPDRRMSLAVARRYYALLRRQRWSRIGALRRVVRFLVWTL